MTTQSIFINGEEADWDCCPVCEGKFWQGREDNQAICEQCGLVAGNMRKLKKGEQRLSDGIVIDDPCPKCGNTGIVLIEVGPVSAQWREELCHFCEHKAARELRNSGNPTWK